MSEKRSENFAGEVVNTGALALILQKPATHRRTRVLTSRLAHLVIAHMIHTRTYWR
jgi:hypothetical protein